MNNKKIEYLAWDSDFFRKKIGRVLINNSDNLLNILEYAKKDGYQLIYAFGNQDFFVNEKKLKQFNGHLADRKVVYEKEIKVKVEQAAFISEYKSDKLIPELEQLAYISGEYSRFKLDKNFEEIDFYRMYKIWLKKHLKTDNIFVAKENDVIKGMMILRIDDKKGHLNLLAVSPDTRGKGYARALISACENKILSKGVSKVTLPTQLDNTQACNLYEKYGFKIEEIVNIYHFWL